MDKVCIRREMGVEGLFLRLSVRQGLLQRTCSQQYYQQVLTKDKYQSGVNFTVSFMPSTQVGFLTKRWQTRKTGPNAYNFRREA
jgi:hypothetical protein